MLIIINGTLGVGKTWIARTLLCQLDNAAYIEGDVLGFVSDDLIQGRSRPTLALDVAYDLIGAYKRQGAKTIVFDYMFTNPILMNDFINRVGGPVHVFYLSAEPKILSDRIRKRGRPQAEQELKEAPAIERTQRAQFVNGLGLEIKTDKMSPDEVADLIRRKLPE